MCIRDSGIRARVAPLEERDEECLRLRVRREAGEDALGGVWRILSKREHRGPELAGRLAGQVGGGKPLARGLLRLGDREEEAEQVALHWVDRPEDGLRVERVR